MTGAPPRWRTDLALALVCLTWGATFIIVKQALLDSSTLLFLAVRFSIAAVILALALFAQIRRGGRSPSRRLALRGGLIAGAFLFTGYVLQTLGLNYTSASKAGFITGLYIPLVPLVGALVYRRRPALFEIAGVTAAAIGMGLMTLEPGALRVNRGDLLVAGCAAAFACHIVILGHYARHAQTALLTVVQISASAVFGLSTFWWAEPVRVTWSPRLLTALGITSVLATALAFLIQTWAQRYSSPTRTAIIFSLEPVFAWATSWIVAGELLTHRALAGATLILGGILAVELKPFQRAESATKQAADAS